MRVCFRWKGTVFQFFNAVFFKSPNRCYRYLDMELFLDHVSNLLAGMVIVPLDFRKEDYGNKSFCQSERQEKLQESKTFNGFRPPGISYSISSLNDMLNHSISKKENIANIGKFYCS